MTLNSCAATALLFAVFCIIMRRRRYLAFAGRGKNFLLSDDSDIKIFVKERPQIYDPPDYSPGEIARRMNAQRANGNLEKARSLGSGFAVYLSRFEPKRFPQELFMNYKTLLAFTMDYALSNLTPNRFIADTAHREFVSALKNIDRPFYDNVLASVEYSMYVLCSRREDNMARKVGETFAKLCGKSEDEACIKNGEALFLSWLSDAMETVEDYKFEP
ncbi:MAG: hypothetical protein LBC56_04655 [Oscillospiraceae bacterium]|nr:hypothetical protein [Oscillospiraceae bacterium]